MQTSAVLQRTSRLEQYQASVQELKGRVANLETVEAEEEQHISQLCDMTADQQIHHRAVTSAVPQNRTTVCKTGWGNNPSCAACSSLGLVAIPYLLPLVVLLALLMLLGLTGLIMGVFHYGVDCVNFMMI
ncbi:MAG: hypothetical protein FRX49_01505 [Trebouxia sp. A1-2]|nr:MAG: hypothetical protein FRX49_01505 [Trebouxia sp. A1-2]